MWSAAGSGVRGLVTWTVRVSICLVFLLLIGSIVYWVYLSANSPSSPDPVAGHTMALNTHGSVTYVHPWELVLATNQFWLGALGAILVGLEQWLARRPS
jgi:hypothetical protein